MTKKQIENLMRLAEINMKSDWLSEDDKINRYREMIKFLETARDLFLITEKQRKKYAEMISSAAMTAWDEYKEEKTA